MKTVYMDHAATTYVYPEVVEAMLPYFQERYGNASSIHQDGRAVRLAVETAREQIADSLNCDASSLVFTSGATEGINYSLFGVTFALENRKPHIVVSSIEHQAVLQTVMQLQRMGAEVSVVSVDRYGSIEPNAVKEAVQSNTALICVMAGNNEVGTLQSIAQIGHFAREKGIYFLVDAVQLLGWMPLSLKELPVDMMTFSAHKIHGPKGTGVLYLHKNVKLLPYQYGGSQERKRRAGTENVPGIIGFSTAVTKVTNEMHQRKVHVEELRSYMLEAFQKQLGEADVIYNGHPSNYLPHILNVSFPWMDTETMLMNLDLAGISASSGSACSSGSFEPSHVLKAMNLDTHIMNSAVRFSFAESNTRAEVDRVVETISAIHQRSKHRARKG